MRAVAIETLIGLAARDPRVMLLVGDIGYTVVERFADRFPDRFLNVGVSEQNLVGLATGLAEGGYVPYLYTIATFATLRPFEFLRNGPALHRLPVRVLGVGGGFEYGTAGPTHFAMEDLGAMRLLPGMTVLAPADGDQARAAIAAVHDLAGPVYVRLGKDDAPPLPGLRGRFRLGRLEVAREGRDVLLVATGAVSREALAAADRLAGRGLDATVAVCASLAPAPAEDLADLLARFPLAVSVEAHVPAGGLGSIVAEAAAASGARCRWVRCAIDADRLGPVGSAAWMLERHGLTAAAIADRALAALAALDARAADPDEEGRPAARSR